MYTLVTLGQLSLECGGRPFTGPSLPRKPLAMLAVLAAEGSTSRDRLMALLWPESDTARARGSLKQALHLLRQQLGTFELVQGSAILRLNPSVIQTDVAQFLAALDAGDLARAAALYGGPFLHGVNLAGVELEHLVDARRAQLARRWERAVEQLALAAETGGDLRAAADRWRELQDANPADSQVALRLMQALDASGQRAAALEHARVHERRVREEWDLPADPAVAAFALQLRAEAAASAASVPSHAASTVPPAGGNLVLQAEAPVASATRTGGRPGGMRARWGLLAACATTLLVVLGASRATRGRAASTRPDLPVVARVVLMPGFGGDTGLAPVVTTALRVDLSQSPAIRLISEQETRAGRRRMTDTSNVPLHADLIAELAAREGAHVVLDGEVLRVGRGVLLTARVVSAESGQELLAVRETAADSSHLLDAIERLSRAVRRRLGESAASVQASPRLERVTTPSLHALRLYTASVNNAGGFESERDGLRAAVALDSGFAIAYLQMARVYRAWLTPAEADVPLLRAHELRDRLPVRERAYVEAQHARFILKDPERARLLLTTLLQRWPEDAEALSILTDIHMLRHEFAQAEEYALRALAIGNRWVDYYNAFVVQVALGKYQAAKATIDRLDDSLPPPMLSFRLRGELTAAQGHYRDAVPHLEAYGAAAERAGGGADFRAANGALAVVAATRGQVRRARELLARDTSWVPHRTLQLASFVLRAGDSAGARRALRAYVRQYPVNTGPPVGQSAAQATVYLELGDRARARELLEKQRSLGDTTSPAWLGASAQLDEAEGRYESAIGRWRRALAQLPPECHSCGMFPLGHAFDLAGQGDSAITWYERALATPASRRVWADWRWLGPTFVRLGELYTSRGRNREAQAMYRAALTLWAEADPEWADIRADLERRVASLE